jgi:hypothetical protein
MNDFVKALTADLRDRRFLPLVALVVVALLAAVAYAALGGGSSATPPAATAAQAPGAGGIAATQASPETAVAETTNGGPDQRKGKAHDPFKLLPGAEKKETGSSTSTSTSTSTSSATSTPSAKSEGSSGSGSGSKSGSGSGEAESKPSKPSKPAKSKTVYHVAVLFGVVPPGTAPLIAQLTPYQSLKLLTPLPSASRPLIVFRGVTAKGKAATFSLVGEAILHGQAACLPNATQCQAIDIRPERYEQLEYLTATGEVVTYELRVVSITAKKASAASVKSFLASRSKTGREVLRKADMFDIPMLRSSSQPGVLVFAARPAHAARAHSAASRGR